MKATETRYVNEMYDLERADAISTLLNVTRRLRHDIEEEIFYADHEELLKIVSAYTPAQLALLQLMREEHEEESEGYEDE